MPDPAPRLTVATREASAVDDLLEYTAPDAPTVWLRRGEGMVGLGTALQVNAAAGSSEPRAQTLGRLWAQVCANAQVADDVHVPGTGLVGFASLTFDERSAASSTIVIPRVIVGRRGGRSWVTTVRVDGDDEQQPQRTAYGPYWSATLGPGALDPDGYQTAVAHALDAIGEGVVGKVVVARDLVGTVPHTADRRRLVHELAAGYPNTWTFAVDGIIGASPETLVSVQHGHVTARVLAGTRSRGTDAADDAATAVALSSSTKDLEEHAYAVHSVVAALDAHTTALSASPHPFTLELPNVWHLATDVSATLTDGSSSFDLLSALHPTAAVAGTPTSAALEVIHRLEPFDRRRYAGPVGWIDADGDGEWAIALRCVQFDADAIGDVIPITAHAGAGIVAGSDPESELLETRLKFRPIIDALA